MAWRHEIVMRKTLTVKSGNKPNKLIMLMKNLSAMFVALSLAGATPFIPMGGGTAYAQTQAGEVTGIVYDSNGEPLIGAVVSVKGTNRGAATDADGKFRLQAKPGQVLVVSYVGAKTQEVAVGAARQHYADFRRCRCRFANHSPWWYIIGARQPASVCC